MLGFFCLAERTFFEVGFWFGWLIRIGWFTLDDCPLFGALV